MAKSEGWIAFLDVFGFTALIDEIGPDELHAKLLVCYEKIKNEVLYNFDFAL